MSQAIKYQNATASKVIRQQSMSYYIALARKSAEIEEEA